MDEKELERRREEEEKRRRAAEAASETNSTTPSVAGQPENKTTIEAGEDRSSTVFLAYSYEANQLELIDPEDPKREKIEIFVFRPKKEINKDEQDIIKNLILENADHFLKHNKGFKDIDELVEYFKSGDYLTKGNPEANGRTGINGFTPELAAESVIRSENKFEHGSGISRTDKGNIVPWPEIQEKLLEKKEKFNDRSEGSYIDKVGKAVVDRELRAAAQTIAGNMDIKPGVSTPTPNTAQQTRPKSAETTR